MKHIFYFIIKSRIFILISVFHSSQNCQDCCRLFCNCCYSDIITEEDIITKEDIITEEDKELTPKILKHLKLDDNNLNKIREEINHISNNIDKINRIIECSKDIDWENECCPNTLIRWENSECAYIAYFHLMLNNPYFLKFFLICDKTMRRKDTYVLNAICECVKWCIDHPSFNKNNMGSVNEIMKAFFRKEKDGEYYYLKKEKERQLKKEKERQFHEGDDFSPLEEYYNGYSNPEADLQLHPYKEKGSQSFDIFKYIHTCIIFDLKKQEDNFDKIFDKTYDFFIENINFESNNKSKFTQESINKIFEEPKSKHEDNSTKHGKIDKLLGVKIYQKEYHYFSIVNYNGIWYNKNTLKKEQCKEMTVNEILKLFNKILGIEKINYKDFDKFNCYFLFSKLYEVQN